MAALELVADCVAEEDPESAVLELVVDCVPVDEVPLVAAIEAAVDVLGYTSPMPNWSREDGKR